MKPRTRTTLRPQFLVSSPPKGSRRHPTGGIGRGEEHMRVRWAMAGAIGVGLLGAPATKAAINFNVSFTTIADNSTSIPAGQWAGQSFAAFTASGAASPPAIDHGNVIF